MNDQQDNSNNVQASCDESSSDEEASNGTTEKQLTVRNYHKRKKKCTFDICAKREDKEKMGKRRWLEHLRRNHQDMSLEFLFALFGVIMEVHRDPMCQMKFPCICEATINCRSSVKRHFVNCPKLQKAVETYIGDRDPNSIGTISFKSLQRPPPKRIIQSGIRPRSLLPAGSTVQAQNNNNNNNNNNTQIRPPTNAIVVPCSQQQPSLFLFPSFPQQANIFPTFQQAFFVIPVSQIGFVAPANQIHTPLPLYPNTFYQVPSQAHSSDNTQRKQDR